jgi:hypothetical protein
MRRTWGRSRILLPEMRQLPVLKMYRLPQESRLLPFEFKCTKSGNRQVVPLEAFISTYVLTADNDVSTSSVKPTEGFVLGIG